uniref:Uncharacterized protein n=1 Tax=Triticum urartu TaxID=4572 RepID=A0A8R7PM27_TRIUA
RKTTAGDAEQEHPATNRSNRIEDQIPQWWRIESEPDFAVGGLECGGGAWGGEGERAADPGAGPGHLERPHLDAELGVELHLHLHRASRQLRPEVGLGHVPLQHLLAAERRLHLRGRLVALEEGVEGREPEALAVVEREGLDVVVVEPHPLVGVAHRHGEREVVLEQRGAGRGAERELGEGGGVDGGGDHLRAEDEVEDEGEDPRGDEERDEDAAEAAEEPARQALERAAQARRRAAPRTHPVESWWWTTAAAAAAGRS